MRYFLPILLLVIAQHSFAQRELIHARDPASMRIEPVNVRLFNLPASFSKYSGIRFLDIRYLQEFAGFIQQNPRSGFRKITTALPFEDELNSALKIRKDSSTVADSVIVVLRNFWLSRPGIKEEMNCHVRAFFFTRRGDTFNFKGRIDTLLNRKAILKYELNDLPALFIEDMLASFNLNNDDTGKHYSEDEFSRLVAQQSITTDTVRPEGLYLSFADFSRKKVYPIVFSLQKFYDQYRIAYDNPGDRELLGSKVWGCWYQGQLYIRQGKLFCKTFAVDNTFILLNNIKTNPAVEDILNPLALNMDTGILE